MTTADKIVFTNNEDPYDPELDLVWREVMDWAATYPDCYTKITRRTQDAYFLKCKTRIIPPVTQELQEIYVWDGHD